MYFHRLREAEFPVAPELARGTCRRYCGDLLALGKGEILVFS
jgi:hypothetical protein